MMSQGLAPDSKAHNDSNEQGQRRQAPAPKATGQPAEFPFEREVNQAHIALEPPSRQCQVRFHRISWSPSGEMSPTGMDPFLVTSAVGMISSSHQSMDS